MEKNPSEPRDGNEKKPTLVVRVPPEMMKAIQEAEEITGATRTRIIEDCVRAKLEEVVAAIIAQNSEQERARKEAWEKLRLKPTNTTPEPQTHKQGSSRLLGIHVPQSNSQQSKK